MKAIGISHRLVLIATIFAAALLPICNRSILHAQLPGPHRLNGTWVNADPNTSGFAKLVIDDRTVHPFGACHPDMCDWGVLEGKSYYASVGSSTQAAMIASHITNFNEVVITLVLEEDGRLRVDSFTHFTDGSRRADYHSSGYLVRADTRNGN